MFKCENCSISKEDSERATPCEDTYPELVDSVYCIYCIDDVISEVELERYSDYDPGEWTPYDLD